MQLLTDTNCRLCGIYGNTIHQNDGTHLGGRIGVAEDAKWQRLYLWVAVFQLLLYNLPNGQWVNRFLETLTGLWTGVMERKWNSERPLVFQTCILCQVRGIFCFHDVKPVIWGWLNAWGAGQYVALVKAVEEASKDADGGGGGTCTRRVDTTSMARKHHNMVLGGKVHVAIRMVTNRDSGGVYCQFDLDTKSGHPIIEVLRAKHPNCWVPSEEDFDQVNASLLLQGVCCQGGLMSLGQRQPLCC